jgi:hypothetical protein
MAELAADLPGAHGLTHAAGGGSGGKVSRTELLAGACDHESVRVR